MFGAIGRRFPAARTTLMRLGVIGVALLGSLMVGRMAVRLRSPQILLAIGFLPGMGLVLLRRGRLEHGVLGIVLAAAAVRFTLPTGTLSEISISLAVTAGVVGLWIVKMLVVEKRVWIKPMRTNVPLLAFMGIAIVSYPWSNAFRDALVVTWSTFPLVQLASLLVIVLLPAAFLLVSNVLEKVVWLKWITWLVIGTGTVAIILHQFSVPFWKVLNVGGIFPTWIVSLTYALALYNEELRPWQRVGLFGVCGLWLSRQLGQGFVWMSGWAPALVALTVITWRRSKKLFLLLMILSMIYVGANFDTLYHRTFVESEEEGDFQRLDLWRTNLELVGNHFIFGTGPAGYAIYYMTYHPENARSTHNNYFDIVAQTGVTGLLAYLWFWTALFYTGCELSRALNHRRDFESAYAAAMLGGCAGAIFSGMLGDWIIPFAYNQTILGFDHSIYAWVLLGGMVSLWCIVRGRGAQARPAGG